MTRPPHYLRVVQALALVSGFGPVAFVAGTALGGCGSFTTTVAGAACPAEGCGPVDAGNDGAVPFLGADTGIAIDASGVSFADSGTSCAPCFPGDASADTDDG